ncbi:MAG TPA: DUF309 domain-containing protein [Methylomirabilota bacterium]|jgi:uncharacterized protein
MPLPLPLRNCLARLILDALHDVAARRALEAVAAVCAEPHALEGPGVLPEAFPREIFERRDGAWRLKSGFKAHEGEFGERAERARRLLHLRPFDAEDPPLKVALVAAALLFHAHLYFEVHELLEPYWLRAGGGDREALQGLIQVAVGFQHLANGNISGARSLLHDGCGRVLERTLEGVPLDPFGRALQQSLDRVLALGDDAPRGFDWNEVPRFPVGPGND